MSAALPTEIAARVIGRALACAAIAGGVSGVSGCAPSPVSLDINFPSAEAFLVTSFVAVDVVAGDTADPCGTALRQVEAGSVPDGLVTSIDSSPPCDLREGVSLADVGPGARAYVVSARDTTNAVLLSGCSVAEVAPGAAPIRVVLFPTANYAAGVARNPPAPGETVMSRCGGP